MDGASRHAHRLANNFLDDLESMQRESRARDRRAMSHLDTGVRSSSTTPGSIMDWTERRRSMSQSFTRSSHSPRLSTIGSYPRHNQYHVIAQRSPVVMMVGKSPYPGHVSTTPASRLVYSNLPTEREQFWYDQVVSNPDATLPTSGLRAHQPPKRHMGASDLYRYSYVNPLRRAISMADLYDSIEEPVSRVVHSAVSRRAGSRSRLSSVPPPTSSYTYRPIFSDGGITPTVSRPYYSTNRYVSESPYYLSPYSHRTAEPSRPILSSHYSTALPPVTRRYTYYYPSVVTGKQYYSPIHRTTSYSSLLPEVQYERRRVERRLDDVMDYKLPPPDYYREMRGSLRGLHDKLDEHRRLLDRYTGLDTNVAPTSVEDRIESKFRQLANRMGRSYTVTARA